MLSTTQIPNLINFLEKFDKSDSVPHLANLSLSDVTFSNINFNGLVAPDSTFIRVTFKNCNLSDCDFSYSTFTNCVFENCCLANINLTEAKNLGVYND